MDDFTKLLMDSIVRQLILPSTDQYGNQRYSPLDEAMRKWAENNRAEILKAISDKLDVKKISDIVSENVMKLIAGVDGKYSHYDRAEYIKELNAEITKRLAQRIADKMDLENK